MNLYYLCTDHQEYDAFIEAITPEDAISQWRTAFSMRLTAVPTQVFRISPKGVRGVLPWVEVFNKYSSNPTSKLKIPPVTESE